MSGRPILQETASEALTNLETDVKGVEESLPSDVYLNVMDRLVVLDDALKRKRGCVKVLLMELTTHFNEVSGTGCLAIIAGDKHTRILELVEGNGSNASLLSGGKICERLAGFLIDPSTVPASYGASDHHYEMPYVVHCDSSDNCNEGAKFNICQIEMV